MRGQTKIAVAIGAVLIVAGIWYVSKGDKDLTSPVAQNTPAEKSAGSSAIPSVTFAGDDRANTAAPQSAAGNTAGAASPSPRVTESPIASPVLGDTPRPQPTETHAPVPPMAATELPKERTGLGGVVPNVSTPVAESSTTSLNNDMPPNTDKDIRPAAPILPPIAPVDIASSSTTKPAVAAPTAPTHTETPVGTMAKNTTTSTPPLTAKPADKPADKLADKTAEKPKAKEHVVQSGETLSSIAVKYFGSVKYKKELIKANPGMKDPNKLYVGAKLIIPEAPAGATAKPVTDTASATAKPADKTTDKAAAKPADKTAVKSTDKSAAKPTDKTATTAKDNQKTTAAVSPADPNRSYTVQAGEGWYDLARKFLGDGKNYPELYEYNKERVGGDPHLLRAGTVIELPPRAKMPARSAPQPSAPATPAPAAPAAK